MAFAGSPIVTLADLSRVWIKIYVNEPVVGLINDGRCRGDPGGQLARSSVSGGGDHYISDEPEFTPKTVQTKEERTKLVFAVKIELDNPEGLLKPGMPADAEIDISGTEKVSAVETRRTMPGQRAWSRDTGTFGGRRP